MIINKKYFCSPVLKNDLLLYEAVIKNEADTVRKVLKETVDVDSRNNVSRKVSTDNINRRNSTTTEPKSLKRDDFADRNWISRLISFRFKIEYLENGDIRWNDSK